jgi:adenine deaminase
MITIKANYVDIPNKKITPATITITDEKLKSITFTDDKENPNLPYILPGFVDSHVHIESSMLVPSEFAKLAVVHGTVATVSDPHEIANVCGMQGIDFMLDNGNTVNFHFNFGAPSCVPATNFETAGATIAVSDVEQLLQRPAIKYLSEMMNFPGVLFNDEDVMKKIALAKQYNKPIDGHAPALRGQKAQQYFAAGITTDHECFTYEEALEKLQLGVHILIREGSAAKNFEALIPLLQQYPNQIMFCSDDKHPDSLLVGYINELCARAVAKGIDVFNVLQAACINPVKHYQLQVGLLQVGAMADCIVVNNLTEFNVLATYIKGVCVAQNGISNITTQPAIAINQFNIEAITKSALQLLVNDYVLQNNSLPVIEALDGQLVTNLLYETPTISNNQLVSNTALDILKIVVVNRYNNAPIAKAFIKGTGLKKGAIASSVAHDSHNIVAIGVDDDSLLQAINTVIENKGGLSAVNAATAALHSIALPVAGLMSIQDGALVAQQYTAIDNFVKQQLGSTLQSPFMTLSFMALLVIPAAKLSDKGLFDGNSFSFITHA